jgi:signal transduction histidine kinase
MSTDPSNKSEIAINFYPDEKNKKVCIKGDASDFSRMMSNIINNSKESIDGKPGVIDISYIVEGEEVKLAVKDNGKGMPQEIAEKK